MGIRVPCTHKNVLPVRVTVGDSGLCCWVICTYVRVMSVRHYDYPPLFVDRLIRLFVGRLIRLFVHKLFVD